MKISIPVPVTILILVILVFPSCTPYDSLRLQHDLGVKLADSTASRETVILYHNLKILSQQKIIFGHQNSSQYGVFWRGDSLRSDVRDVTGSFPGLYGWDFESMPKSDSVKIGDHVPVLVRQAYGRGGINTFSWHIRNPVTGNLYNDTTIAVREILPGGRYYLKYLRMLDTLADYTRQFEDPDGRPIPIIFRPYHEFDGNWFWWGKNFCTREEFIRLWHITVDYLRAYKKVTNFLYAFSSDCRFESEEEFLDRYPGDSYVDIVGLDDYHDFKLSGDSSKLVQTKLKIISSIAAKRGKIAAFTETGSELVPDSTWWTRKLYSMVDNDSVKIAYVMLWRNAHQKHFYVPFKGHPAEQDFVEFRRKPKMLFEEDLPDLYHSVILTDWLARLHEQGTQPKK